MSVQTLELDDARKGAVYFLGQLEVERRPSFDIGLISNFVSGTSILGDIKNATTSLIKQADAGKKIIDGISRFIDPIKNTLAEFFDKLTDHFTSMYGEASAGLEWVGEFGAWAVSTLVGSLSDIIPGWGYVEGAADLYDGVKQSVISSVKWLGQVYSGWGIKLLDGSPTIIASSIARHNATALAGGLKDTALAVTKISLQAAGDAAGGVGSIVGMVTGILQRIANILGYCVQRFLIARTFNQASYHWSNQAELVTDHERFTEWFRRSCVCTPIIAALTMQSGLVANPLRFLALIDNNDDIISQKKYDKGVEHIEKLKGLSKSYINEYTDSYKFNFKSEDPFVAARIQQAFL